MTILTFKHDESFTLDFVRKVQLINVTEKIFQQNERENYNYCDLCNH